MDHQFIKCGNDYKKTRIKFQLNKFLSTFDNISKHFNQLFYLLCFGFCLENRDKNCNVINK